MRLYSNKEDAARELVMVFQDMGWRWSGLGVPGEADILSTFINLEEHLKTASCTQTGRLMVTKLRGTEHLVYSLNPVNQVKFERWNDYGIKED